MCQLPSGCRHASPFNGCGLPSTLAVTLYPRHCGRPATGMAVNCDIMGPVVVTGLLGGELGLSAARQHPDEFLRPASTALLMRVSPRRLWRVTSTLCRGGIFPSSRVFRLL